MIKKFKPTSPGRRHRVVIVDTSLNYDDSIGKLRSLKKRKSNTGGRNHSGKITIRYRGGGHKKIVRNIDHDYKKGLHSVSTIIQIEYSPKMGGNLALCAVGNHAPFYRMATQDMTVGDTFTGPYVLDEIPKDGDVKFLKDIPQGRHIHSVEMIPGAGASLARSAGAFATLLSHLPSGYSIVMLPSKKTITLRQECLATLGKVGNAKHYLRKLGKAGAARWRGKRPVVRGEAMNAVDHPHGGASHGSGGKGKPIKNIWGKLAKFTSPKKS